MGPSSLRIIDELLSEIKLEGNIRILDLGCGRGLTSIYLANKYDSFVYATDLWISATENYERFKSRGLENRIIPIHAEAHALPFSNDYFDMIVSVDAFHYFGTDGDYLSRHLLPLLKVGGRLIIGVPGLKQEFSAGIPNELKLFLQDDMNFHSCEWWMDHWKDEKEVIIEKCYGLKCFESAWADWLECDNEHAVGDRDMMLADSGKYLSLVGIVAKKCI